MPPVLPIIANATADASGNIAFTFEQVGPDVVMQGTVAVPTAPVGAHFIANVSGVAIGAFDGYNPWGPVQVDSYQQLTLSGSGLTPHASYQAVWMAAQYPPGTAPVPPTPYGSATTLTGPVDAQITGPVNVTGTVSVGNTPSVTISGTPTISLASGSSVSIAGTPTVNLASGATVGISGTPTVVIEPGTTVNITGPVSLSQGSQLTNTSGISTQGTHDQLTSADLGDGLDGTVTITANAALVRDMQYSSLTVNSGVVLSSNGYVIRATGTVTVNGTIDNSGQNGVAGSSTPALGGAAGTLPGGATGVLNSGTNSSIPGNSPIASAVVAGGPGGSAQNRGGGTVPASSPTPLTISSSRTTIWAGGASGAAAANSGSTAASGGGGGVVVIICATLAGSGTVSANAGTSAFSGTAASAGGSGGGIVFIATFNAAGFTGTLSANGSAAASSSAFTATGGGPGRTALVTSS